MQPSTAVTSPLTLSWAAFITVIAESNFRYTQASKVAFDASRAKRAADFKPLIVQLREACNGCHAVYLKID